MVFANSIATGPGVYDVIWFGAVIAGIGWGHGQTVINPLIATLYPDSKTARLNALHAWWPGGLVIGGLLGVGMSKLGLGWQIKLALVVIPALAVVALSVGVKFPPTERMAAGISMKQMFRELLNPLFVILFASMFLTAATELAPGQWVDLALTQTAQSCWEFYCLALRERADVSDEAFRGASSAQIIIHWPVMAIVPDGFDGIGRVKFRQFARNRFTGGDFVGHRSLLHVADHARDGIGADFPAEGHC